MSNVFDQQLRRPLVSGVPRLAAASRAADGGGLSGLTSSETDGLVTEAPELRRFIRRWVNSRALGLPSEQWCLIFGDDDPRIAVRSVALDQRLEIVRSSRLASSLAIVRNAVSTPWLFLRVRQPVPRQLVVPGRFPAAYEYMPGGFYDAVADEDCVAIEGATLALAGFTMSRQFRLWAELAGRDGSEVEVSSGAAYNHFPFPEIDDATERELTDAARGVLTVRINFTRGTVDDLYMAERMPFQLRAAHDALDRAVAKALGIDIAADDASITAHLKEAHDRLVLTVTGGSRGAQG